MARRISWRGGIELFRIPVFSLLLKFHLHGGNAGNSNGVMVLLILLVLSMCAGKDSSCGRPTVEEMYL